VEEARREWFDAAPWAAWLVIPFGLTFTVLLTRTCFDGTAGSGIPLEMTAFILADGDPNLARIFSARIMVGKVALTLLGQLCGASSGREGPTVQVDSRLRSPCVELSHVCCRYSRLGVERGHRSWNEGCLLL